MAIAIVFKVHQVYKVCKVKYKNAKKKKKIKSLNSMLFSKKIKIFLSLFLLTSFFVAQNVLAAPIVDNVSGEINNGQNVFISGSGFGEKTVAAPIYWDNLESYELNSSASVNGWIIRAGTPTISNEKTYSGSRAIRYSNTAFDVFQQMSRDMGMIFNDTFYFEGKVYLDDTGNTCDRYQWKNIMLSSSPGAYFPNEETIPPTTSIMYMNTWRDTTNDIIVGGRWFNTGNPQFNYGGNFTVGIPNGTPYYGEITAPFDLFPLKKWFDYKIIAKQSSAPDVADGSVIISIDDIQKISASGIITYGPNDGLWRYMMLGGTIASCRMLPEDTQTNPNYRIYYDDIYVDRTQARIEICDTASWHARTHCEIQPATSWNDNDITFNMNKGSFINGSNAYIYAIDENGIANSNGYPVTIGSKIGQAYSILDFTTLVPSWLHIGSRNSSDLNTDNIVNTKDLGIMMSKWN